MALQIVLKLALIASIIAGATASFDISEFVRGVLHKPQTPIVIHAVGANGHLTVAGLKANGYQQMSEKVVCHGNPAAVEIYSPGPMTLRVLTNSGPIRVKECDQTNICIVTLSGRREYTISADVNAYYKPIGSTPLYYTPVEGITVILLLVIILGGALTMFAFMVALVLCAALYTERKIRLAADTPPVDTPPMDITHTKMPVTALRPDGEVNIPLVNPHPI